MRKSKRSLTLAAAIVGFAFHPATGNAADLKLDLPVFPVPSLSNFTPPIIKAKKFDHANGLDINFVVKAARSYRTDFASGTNKVGGSGTVLADVAKLTEKGVSTVYLFNVFDFWGTVVVSAASNIHSLKDLEGRTLAAALPTTNYAMFRYFAQAAGVDLSKLAVQGSTVPGLVALAAAGRVDAVQMWEPARSVLTYGNNKYRSLDIIRAWKKKTGGDAIPYLGVAAHREWVAGHKAEIQRLYRTYDMAAKFVKEHPADAASIISDASNGKLKRDMLVALIKSDRLGLSVYWGAKRAGAAAKIFQAAVTSHYLERMPPESVLYDGGGK
ncbi:MAG TPA: ABC transporter substrate-binding protein [Burkholderiales bacterium]|nr:ABC transporter substrate-binding protein [Burkholderiales bacterium]